MATVTQRGSGLSVVNFDIMVPQHRASAARRLTNMALSGSAEDISAGKYWYPEAHEAMHEMSRTYEHPVEAAAGATAVLSGGAEWSQKNKAMTAQALELHPSHWNELAASHASEITRVAGLKASGALPSTAGVGRTEEMKAMLREHAPALGQTTNSQLLKARRMIHGGGAGSGPEHPLSVMDPDTSPKYRAFYGGLIDPRHRRVDVPVDYRAADINRNEMQPRDWKGRGIDYFYPKRGQDKSPYMHHEQLIADVASATRQQGGRKFAGVSSPLSMQAYLWGMGKNYELHMPGSKESRQRPGERFSGPTRTGQRYTTQRGSWAPY